MAAIFLSYAREDRLCAERLAEILADAGHDVWWDRHIGTGREFTEEIEAALDEAAIILVAWSKHSAKSPWVKDEAAAGRDSGRLLPVVIDETSPPLGFRQFQALDLRGWKGRSADRRTTELVEAVDARLSGTVPPRKPVTEPDSWRWRRATVAGGFLALLLAVATLFFLANRPDIGDISRPKFALLPFTTSSPDAQLRDLATQTRDSIAHTFAQSGVPVALVNASSGDGSADYVIAGEFGRNAEKVVATIRLQQAANRMTVYSRQFQATEVEVQNLAERIGAQMAGNLVWAAPLMMLMDRGRPIDPALSADLLSMSDFTGDPLQGYQNARRVAARAPNLMMAQLSLAFQTSFVLAELPRAERAEAVAEARRAAERAAALGPRFGDVYAPWCLLHSEDLLAACEDRLRDGRKVDSDAPFLNTFLSHLLRNVGRFEEATDLAKLAYTHDIYVPTKIAWMLKSLEYEGERNRTKELYEQAARWWPEYRPMFFSNRLYALLERGDFAAMRALEQEVGVTDFLPDYVGSEALIAAQDLKSPSAVIKACGTGGDYLLDLRCMLILARIGDEDGAFAIAAKLYPSRIGSTPADTERIWLDNPDTTPLEFVTSPAAAPMRRDPRYMDLIRRTGLLRYWRSGRLPDFCRTRPEPICAQLFAGR